MTVLSALLIAGLPLSSQSPGAWTEAFLEPYAKAGLLSGVVLVAKGENVLFQKAYGLAHDELGVPNAMDTRFAIASINKAMTITVVMQLLEEGKLKAADKLSQFIPSYPRGDEITITHLLNHRAGIPHRVLEEAEEALPFDAEKMAARAAKKPLMFTPGERSVYSSAGFSVLARVVETVEKRPFAQSLEERVFQKAGMAQSADAEPYVRIEKKASSYVWTPSGPVPHAPKDLSFLVGAGSVWSTAGDLLKFATAVRTGKLGNFAKQNYDRERLYINGVTGGYRAILEYDKKSDTALIVCTNMVTGVVDRLRADFFAMVGGATPTTRSVPSLKAAPLSPEELRELEGAYRLGEGAPMEVRAVRRLLLIGDGILLPVGRDKLFALRDFGEVGVERSPDGKVAALLWKPEGVPEPLRMEKVR